MAIPRVRSIIREDVPGSPDWIESLLTLLNRGFTDVSDVLEHGLTVADNQMAEVKNITVTMPAEFPTWHQVGAPGEPAFQNGWSNWDSVNLFGARFRMLPDGFVHLSGFLKFPPSPNPATNYTTIFQLPAGYAPPKTMRFGAAVGSSPGVGNPSMGILNIHVGGAVQFAEGNASSGTYFQIDGISYQANATAAKADTFAKPFPIAVATSGRFPIKQCTAMNVVDKTDKSRGVLGPVHVVWEPNGTGLTINAIWGLQPGRTYGIDLLMSAG